MKKLISFFACCIIGFSCKNNTSKTIAATKTDNKIGVAEPVVKVSEIDGLWTGTFDMSTADETLQKKAQDFEEAYYKKKYKYSGDDEYDSDESITNINEIPADLRKAYFMEPLNGYYTWKGSNKVSIIIIGLNNPGQIIGKSVCAGNERMLNGTYNKIKDIFTAELKEPGDDKNDGLFKLDISNTSGKATGTWTSLSGDIKKCDLEKKDFSYSAEAGNIQGFRQKNKDGYLEFKKNPSVDLLSTIDVENLTKPELAILRNLIFARHGYTFASASFRNYFEREPWYIPLKKDIRADLTELEKKNAEKLKSFEKYASAAYDEFGR